MVDLKASNEKLVERAKRIIMTITGASLEKATEVLNESNQSVKPAIIMIETGSSYLQAKQALEEKQNLVREAISFLKRDMTP